MAVTGTRALVVSTGVRVGGGEMVSATVVVSVVDTVVCDAVRALSVTDKDNVVESNTVRVLPRMVVVAVSESE